VPEERVVPLTGGERLEIGGRTFEVAYTPGHAAHHVSYFDRSSGVAFVGDTAGVCIDGGYVLPPTPPPDIDIDLWRMSAARIEAWAPQTLFITHFGPVHRPVPHMGTLIANLETMAAMVQRRLNEAGSDEDRSRRFTEDFMRELERQMTQAQLEAYMLAAPPKLLWLGLARYWRKRGG
jgi:glyoxylase-like metal-dependent hydrolase (beta-lactamase superfamily II)